MTVLFNFFQPKADGWRGPGADERGVTGADGRVGTGADGRGGTCRKNRNRSAIKRQEYPWVVPEIIHTKFFSTRLSLNSPYMYQNALQTFFYD